MFDDFEDTCEHAALRELAFEYADANREYFGNRLRPVPLMLSDGSSRLGCFVADPRRIELSRALVMSHPWGTVIEVLKHEMAHQFVAEVLGEREETGHGPAFRRVCEQLGIDARASGLPEATSERSPILERIRKLFALASSDNQHEAEAAMRMAHRLMLKHNIERPSERSSADYGFRHLGRYTGRVSEAESVLGGLLGEFFFVQPIWVSVFRVQDQKRVSVLEVTGRTENLAMAEYVYDYLLRAAEALWLEHKKKHGIRGNADRRTFMAGVMRGFADKLRHERTVASEAGLVWVGDPEDNRYFRRRHPRVQRASFGTSANSAAASHGRAAGRELVLSRPISEGPTKKVRALPG
jgi:predicted SprT family Zn-dependent metalloprotease